ncbi:MAG TPA: 16S rRNA (cytidine(1402)-2'-O)-methyltransferase [Candidatus Paceibacterota bacterium]|nr:16S rRNA (cytidine(1402)-2'-O)-methyltransferase [Candidatus Paceibacterota bacterium]
MKLYLIGTPIGNLADITPRAVAVMKEIPVLAVEKWTDTVKLLKHFEIGEKKIINYDDKNSRRMAPKILEILKEQDVALVTSAGMPGVSDPGAYLVEKAREAGHEIVPIPGPSALSTAIACSGFSGHFWFVEFLPRTRGKIVKILNQAEEIETNLVCFESTYRLTKTLEIINELYPTNEVFVGKEMTKKFEQYLVGRAGDFLVRIKADKDFVRGEFVLVIHFGKKAKNC